MNEVIETIKKMVADGNLSQEVAEKYFPQLKKSYDEKIRKDIISFVEQAIDAGYGIISKERKEEWVAWLEKQKGLFEPLDWKEYKDKPVKLWNSYVHGLAVGLERGKAAVINNPKDYGFENPVEWSEEDERNLKGIIDEIEANKHDAPDYDIVTYDRFLSWLESLKDRYTWKPSGMQMRILSIYADQNNTHGAVLTSLYQDLKKLKRIKL